MREMPQERSMVRQGREKQQIKHNISISVSVAHLLPEHSKPFQHCIVTGETWKAKNCFLLTSPDSRSREQGTVVAPWGSCRCTGDRVAPDTWSPAAVTGSTVPSWPATLSLIMRKQDKLSRASGENSQKAKNHYDKVVFLFSKTPSPPSKPGHQEQLSVSSHVPLRINTQQTNIGEFY